METKLQIYGEGRNRTFEKELKRLKEWKISSRNKELITQFHNFLFSTGSGELRVAKLSSQLRRMALILNKDLDQVIKQDIQRLVALINTQWKTKRGMSSEATKSDYRRSIKQFYKWFKEEDERLDSEVRETRKKWEKFYKYLEKGISISYKKGKIDPATILNEEDVNSIISSGCKTVKEKAFIKFLHETGVRAGELLNMKIKDIVIKEDYAKVIVDGKTGMREIPITSSVSYLTTWIEFHPFKNNENAYLWVGENPRMMYEPLKHAGGQKLIDRCVKRAELEKKHNLHWFRHSRATLLAPHLTEALLCKYMGWILGSRQVRTYLHLCNQQLEDAYLKLSGLKTTEKKNKNKPKKCGCGAVNDSISRYCFKCGRPISVEVVIQDQEMMKTETNKSINLLMEIAEDPKLMKQFMEFKEKMKG